MNLCGFRGFESHPHRHFHHELYFHLYQSVTVGSCFCHWLFGPTRKQLEAISGRLVLEADFACFPKTPCHLTSTVNTSASAHKNAGCGHTPASRKNRLGTAGRNAIAPSIRQAPSKMVSGEGKRITSRGLKPKHKQPDGSKRAHGRPWRWRSCLLPKHHQRTLRA